MRCRQAERLIIEREMDSRLVAELAALRTTPPLTFDASARVMQRVAHTGRIAPLNDPSRGLGWATAAACAVGLFLALTLVSALPALPRLFTLARGGPTAIGQAWDRALPALVALFTLPFRLLGPMLELVSGLGSLLGRLEPLAYIAALCGCMAMFATIATVVTRDLALGQSFVSRKEP